MEYKDYNKPLEKLKYEHFLKLFVKDFIEAFTPISESKQFLVIMHALSCIDSRNICVATQKEISDSAKVSYKTVQIAFKKMREHDIMREWMPGVFMFNPNIVCRGKSQTKQLLLKEYAALRQHETT
jgi:hypothetical protein